MSDYPRTIDNGAGEKLTFVAVGTDERGEYLEARNAVAPGSGPPMHVHRLQEESLTVERGSMGWQRQGEEEQLAGVGETVTFARGEMHRFWNAGEDDLVWGLADIPAPAQRFVFPVVVAIGRALGRGKRFAGAPEPVTRA